MVMMRVVGSIVVWEYGDGEDSECVRVLGEDEDGGGRLRCCLV